MPLPIAATISVPTGYRLLPAACIQRKTDLCLNVGTLSGKTDPRQIGWWEVTPYRGFRACHLGGLVIRRIGPC